MGTFSAPAEETPMSYRIAGIDVHKRMLAVVVADVAVEGEFGHSSMSDRDFRPWFEELKARVPTK